jgi:hypothetical protein
MYDYDLTPFPEQSLVYLHAVAAGPDVHMFSNEVGGWDGSHRATITMRNGMYERTRLHRPLKDGESLATTCGEVKCVRPEHVAMTSG